MRLCFTSSPSSCARIWCLTVPCSAAVADASHPAALLALLVFATVLSCRRFTPMHALAALVLAVLLPIAFAAVRAVGLGETTLASYDGCALPQHEPGSLLGVVHSHVRNRVALLAGTGPSAGAVDTSAAEWLEENMDVWALNQFFLHPALSARFYNLEMRSLGDASNDEYWRRFFVGQKRLRYEQTLFLARTQHAPAVRRVLCAATPAPKGLVTYHVTVRNAGFRHACRNYEASEADVATPSGIASEHCSSSITRVLSLMAACAYSHIALVGVDLLTPRHFYTDNAALLTTSPPAFESAAADYARGHGGGALHMAGVRGIDGFLEGFSRAHVRVVNLALSSALVNSSLSTVPLDALVRPPHAAWPLSIAAEVADGGRSSSSPTHRSRRFLTYGSACQDCGFNNQRLDLEAAWRLAIATRRTLVVRNVACSPHSPCPNWTASSDGVIAALGGVSRWRHACNQGVVTCDKERATRQDPKGGVWGAGVGFLPASLVWDSGQFGADTVWQDDFHSEQAALLTSAGAAGWVMVQREAPLTATEREAVVWHVQHLHKQAALSHPNLPPQSRWPPYRTPRHARWLRAVAAEVVAHARAQGPHSGSFACAHARLGDWGPHVGRRGAFDGEQYARALASLLHAPSEIRTSLPGDGAASNTSQKPLLLVATFRAAFLPLQRALSRHFTVIPSASASPRLSAHLASHAPPGVMATEDLFSIVEQLVCVAATRFVGTPGSTWSAYVHRERANRGANRGQSLSTTQFISK